MVNKRFLWFDFKELPKVSFAWVSNNISSSKQYDFYFVSTITECGMDHLLVLRVTTITNIKPAIRKFFEVMGCP